MSVSVDLRRKYVYAKVSSLKAVEWRLLRPQQIIVVDLVVQFQLQALLT